MNKLTNTLGAKKYLAAAIPLIIAAQAQGLEFYTGSIEGSLSMWLSIFWHSLLEFIKS